MGCRPWHMAEADRRDYNQPLGEAHRGIAYKIAAGSLLSVVDYQLQHRAVPQLISRPAQERGGSQAALGALAGRVAAPHAFAARFCYALASLRPTRTAETRGAECSGAADRSVADLRRGIGFVAGAYRLEVRCPPSTARMVPVI